MKRYSLWASEQGEQEHFDITTSSNGNVVGTIHFKPHAEFIVTACNAHDQLVAALQDARLKLLSVCGKNGAGVNFDSVAKIDEALKLTKE